MGLCDTRKAALIMPNTPRAFDSAATGYDQVFTDSEIGALQRGAVHRHLERTVLGSKSLSILELGCGTGEDAVFFAERGHTVTATDVSTAMLDRTNSKAEARGLGDRVRITPLDLQAPETSGLDGPFDLVFSNFGALNCIDSQALHRLAGHLENLTAAGSAIVVVVMPRACVWESLYFLGQARPTAAFRRFSKGPVAAPVGPETVRTWYHSPRTITGAFGRAFCRNALVPIGLAVPPSFLEPWAVRHPRILAALARLDRSLRPIATLAFIADHALVHLERT
ncbi:MAG: class I SAM-dependent methyltransferase [Acidobacteriota bacterium]